MGAQVEYLTEHVDEILSALRHSKDLICKGSWETTAWARSMADAVRLAEALREGVFAEVDLIGGRMDACIGLVRRKEVAGSGLRCGVLVRLSRR